MRWWLAVVFRVASRTFRLRIEIEEPELTREEAAARITSPGSSTSRPTVITSTSGARTSRRTSFGGSTRHPIR